MKKRILLISLLLLLLAGCNCWIVRSVECDDGTSLLAVYRRGVEPIYLIEDGDTLITWEEWKQRHRK